MTERRVSLSLIALLLLSILTLYTFIADKSENLMENAPNWEENNATESEADVCVYFFELV